MKELNNLPKNVQSVIANFIRVCERAKKVVETMPIRCKECEELFEVSSQLSLEDDLDAAIGMVGILQNTSGDK